MSASRIFRTSTLAGGTRTTCSASTISRQSRSEGAVVPSSRAWRPTADSLVASIFLQSTGASFACPGEILKECHALPRGLSLPYISPPKQRRTRHDGTFFRGISG
ncbi:MAG TPA: hypothetical protein VHX61_18450 [Rhizomicrobium sp.]|nr:hypothetical protein [Rhizomicrobium sp.]